LPSITPPATVMPTNTVTATPTTTVLATPKHSQNRKRVLSTVAASMIGTAHVREPGIGIRKFYKFYMQNSTCLMSDNLTNKTYLVIKYSVFANEGKI
jgi:hypothetical protein